MTLTFFAALVLLAGLLSPPAQAAGWLLVWSLFGAGATVLLTALGGSPLSPAFSWIPFLLWKTWRLSPAGRSASAPGEGLPPGFWLGLCVAWAVLGAVLIPRLLAGDAMVYVTQRASTTRAGVVLVPLQPVIGNLTQAVYAVANLVVFLCVARLAALPGGLLRLRAAMGVLAALSGLCVLLNLGETYLHLPSALALVRNGGYAVMVGGDIGGLQRISGTFAEASAFIGFTLPVFAFCFALWLQGDAARWPLWAALGLGLALLLATSTTGYVAAALYLAGVGLQRLAQVQSPASLRLWRGALLAGLGLALLLLAVLMLWPGALARVAHFADLVLGSKLHSSSGEERMRWNLQGLRNLVETGGLGVGLGSARTSSFLIVLASNLGLPGLLCYGLFLRGVFGTRSPDDAADPQALRIRSAFRHALAAALCAAVVSGTVFERGAAFYVYAAAACVSLAGARARAPVQHATTHRPPSGWPTAWARP